MTNFKTNEFIKHLELKLELQVMRVWNLALDEKVVFRVRPRNDSYPVCETECWCIQLWNSGTGSLVLALSNALAEW